MPDHEISGNTERIAMTVSWSYALTEERLRKKFIPVLVRDPQKHDFSVLKYFFMICKTRLKLFPMALLKKPGY